VCVDSNSAIPVQSDECPGQRSSDSWDMDKSRVSVVAEIEEGQVEEVDNQDDLSPDEVRTDKQHDEGKLKEIVENKVVSNVGCCSDMVDIAGE
jgi:hypothetical protein